MTNREQQGERLAFIIITLDLSQIKFCLQSGIQQSHLSNAIKGKKGISFTMLEKIATHYPRVNINYIFTGVGPVLFEEYQVHELREFPNLWQSSSTLLPKIARNNFFYYV